MFGKAIGNLILLDIMFHTQLFVFNMFVRYQCLVCLFVYVGLQH
jgi:hypothetical protein